MSNPRSATTPWPAVRLLLVAALMFAPPQTAATAATAASAAPKLEIDGLVFQVPPTWRAVPRGSAMRRAEYRIAGGAGAEDEVGRAVFYRFSAGAGGTPEANIARWYRQFREPRADLDATLTVAGVPGRRRFVFRAFGTLIGRGPDGQPVQVPDYGFLGALLETAKSTIFIRAVAPAAVVRRDDAAFRAMIDGVDGESD